LAKATARTKSFLAIDALTDYVQRESWQIRSRGSIGEAGWLPVVGQQFFEAIRRVRWQPLENVFEIRVRLMPVDAGGIQQAHDVGGALEATGCRSSHSGSPQTASIYAGFSGFTGTTHCSCACWPKNLPSH